MALAQLGSYSICSHQRRNRDDWHRRCAHNSDIGLCFGQKQTKLRIAGSRESCQTILVLRDPQQRVRAQERGFELPDETGRYLMSRYPRDLSSLFAVLDRLDQASLQAQRRLTVPFVKQVLEGSDNLEN